MSRLIIHAPWILHGILYDAVVYGAQEALHVPDPFHFQLVLLNLGAQQITRVGAEAT